MNLQDLEPKPSGLTRNLRSIASELRKGPHDLVSANTMIACENAAEILDAAIATMDGMYHMLYHLASVVVRFAGPWGPRKDEDFRELSDARQEIHRRIGDQKMLPDIQVPYLAFALREIETTGWSIPDDVREYCHRILKEAGLDHFVSEDAREALESLNYQKQYVAKALNDSARGNTPPKRT